MNFFYFLFKKIIGKFTYEKKKIKLGFDPTNYTIHIGHLLLINFVFYLIKKQFIIIFIIGDFTTKLKKKIKNKLIIINSISLKSQIYNLIGDVKIYYNSIWINKKKLFFYLKILDLLKINKYINNNLKKKLTLNKLSINNIMYPIFQSYDSIIVNSDIEIGGIDQLLNVICGRFLQKIFKQKKQNSILLLLLEKKKKKISKSDNYTLKKNIKDNDLMKMIFFNIKKYFLYKKKHNYYYFNFLTFNNYIKKIYFKKKNYLSYYYKNIFCNNKFLFNAFLYKKQIFVNKKILIKNFFLKKNIYNINNNILIIYD